MQMDILGLVSELPIKTVGICFLRVKCGQKQVLMCVCDKRKNDVMEINVQ